MSALNTKHAVRRASLKVLHTGPLTGAKRIAPTRSRCSLQSSTITLLWQIRLASVQRQQKVVPRYSARANNKHVGRAGARVAGWGGHHLLS